MILSPPRKHLWQNLPPALGVLPAVMGRELRDEKIDEVQLAARRTLTRGEIGILHSNAHACSCSRPPRLRASANASSPRRLMPTCRARIVAARPVWQTSYVLPPLCHLRLCAWPPDDGFDTGTTRSVHGAVLDALLFVAGCGSFIHTIASFLSDINKQ